MIAFVPPVPATAITRFCRRWLIRELALFGSAMRQDFGADSDVDVLATFSDRADWSLLDHVQMQQELQTLFGRNVDLITKRALERSHNWMLRNEILRTTTVLFPS